MTSLGSVRRDGNTAPFLDATARGEFLLRRCTSCQHIGGPQEALCPACGSSETGWVPAAGGAKVVSWSVVHARHAPPTITVIAEFDEGPWWWSQLVDADPDALSTGRRLRVGFEEADGGETLPVFRLA